LPHPLAVLVHRHADSPRDLRGVEVFLRRPPNRERIGEGVVFPPASPAAREVFGIVLKHSEFLC
jgi:hypothetical protein